jgi:DNA-binding LacI/PurR family transcriptional regulator
MAYGTKLRVYDLRRWALAAECDPRTIAKAILGEPVQPMLRQRILRAARELGYAPPPNSDAGSGSGGEPA